MECPAYSDVREKFRDLYEDCDGVMVRLMCHPKQRRVAQLIHQLRCFRDSDTVFYDTQLDAMVSDVDDDDDDIELVEVLDAG